MVPYIHPERTEDVASNYCSHDPGPAEEPGEAREKRNKMDKKL
jgi:hypothetical protein